MIEGNADSRLLDGTSQLNQMSLIKDWLKLTLGAI
jgi:hypothetical protein